MAKNPTAQGASSAPRFIAVGIAPTDEQIVIQTSRARHVIAMANAGAAKTTTLALRIAESITRGVWPESIVALTFSSRALKKSAFLAAFSPARKINLHCALQAGSVAAFRRLFRCHPHIHCAAIPPLPRLHFCPTPRPGIRPPAQWDGASKLPSRIRL